MSVSLVFPKGLLSQSLRFSSDKWRSTVSLIHMRRPLQKALIAVTSLFLVVLAWSIADCFLFEHRVRELLRQVENIRLGTPRDQVLWMKDEYFPLASDEDFSGNIELQVYQTKLDYLRYPFHVVPRKLLMRDAVAGGVIQFKDRKTVSGKIIGVSSDFDEHNSPRTQTDVTEGRLSYPPMQLVAHRDGFDVARTEFGIKVIVVPEATARQKDVAYRVDFYCLWRWNSCKEGSTLLSAARFR